MAKINNKKKGGIRKHVKQSYKGVEFEDEKTFIRIYDKKLFERVLVATHKGRSIGNCIKENSELYFKYCSNSKYKNLMFVQAVWKTPRFDNIMHVFLLYEEDGCIMYERKSNGSHEKTFIGTLLKNVDKIYFMKKLYIAPVAGRPPVILKEEPIKLIEK